MAILHIHKNGTWTVLEYKFFYSWDSWESDCIAFSTTDSVNKAACWVLGVAGNERSSALVSSLCLEISLSELTSEISFWASCLVLLFSVSVSKTENS